VKICDVFDTRIEEKIEPVVKVGELGDPRKLADELRSYVVTPNIEKYVDDFFELYTDTFYKETPEIGVWISGYFGSGKSYLAKIIGLIAENRDLLGSKASDHFITRIQQDSERRASLTRSLSTLSRCQTQVMAFNINTLADSRNTHLARLLLSQYYQRKGYCSNIIYANVIEAELDRLGKLSELHRLVESKSKTSWSNIQKNPAFYSHHLYQAACEVAPEVFPESTNVEAAMKQVESGELFNIQYLIRKIIDDLEWLEKRTDTRNRIILILDESGQWIEDSADRLSQLQSLVEEAAIVGKGRIWIVVTTHEDMGTVIQNARALTADMKKIESRFRFKFSLTTENIELVLKDRIFKKNMAGGAEISRVYGAVAGELRGLGELSKTLQNLPQCTEENFVTFYPFFPYQIHLIPDVVKSLRSHGGRGEQLSGSTRTLLAITQDIIRVGRRRYLNLGIGELVSFDEVYSNLAEGAEVSPDIRRELGQIEEKVPQANALTRRVAEVLYLIGEVPYIPRTIDNVARLLVESTSDSLPSLITRIQLELEKLINAKLVARIGDEYEFLSGERRTFEESLLDFQSQFKRQDREKCLSSFAEVDMIGFQSIQYKGQEFAAKILFDESTVKRDGDVEIRIYSPFAALSGIKLSDLEDQSIHQEFDRTIFILSDRISGFDRELDRYWAMKAVIDDWKGDATRSEEARKLAADRESNDLRKLRDGIKKSISEGLKNSHIIFHGSSRSITVKSGQTAGDAIKAEIASFWSSLYPKFDKVPVRISNDQQAIRDILSGRSLSPDVLQLGLFEKSGALNNQAPLLDEIRIYLLIRQNRQVRTLGKDLITEFTKPPYGWDPGVVRVGVAAFVREGSLTISVDKRPYHNPGDPVLEKAIRDSRVFNNVELVLEEQGVDFDALGDVRKLLITVGARKPDETPAALSVSFDEIADELWPKVSTVNLWASTASFPLPSKYIEGVQKIAEVKDLTSPNSRISEIHLNKDKFVGWVSSIRDLADFQKKYAESWKDLAQFYQNLNWIRYHFSPNSACDSFLRDFEDVKKNSTFAETAVWRELQQKKAQADLELRTLIDGWRSKTRTEADALISEIPGMLQAEGLEPELAEDFSKPTKQFVESIDLEVIPVKVVLLPRRVDELREALQRMLVEQKRKRQPVSVTPGPISKELVKVRVASIMPGTRIVSSDDWNRVRSKLDEIVKKYLREEKEVELV
jgi:hypothetical protein